MDHHNLSQHHIVTCAHCPLPATHFQLSTSNCPLPGAHGALPTAHCLLPMPTAHCLAVYSRSLCNVINNAYLMFCKNRTFFYLAYMLIQYKKNP